MHLAASATAVRQTALPRRIEAGGVSPRHPEARVEILPALVRKFRIGVEVPEADYGQDAVEYLSEKLGIESEH
jgi:hypothetical protein